MSIDSMQLPAAPENLQSIVAGATAEIDSSVPVPRAAFGLEQIERANEGIAWRSLRGSVEEAQPAILFRRSSGHFQLSM